VQGTNYKLSLRVSERTKFPAKSSKEREKLNQLIKSHNLWLEMSELDTTQFGQHLKDGKIDPSLAKKIKPYLEESETKAIYLSKLK
jgi:hypothetical protein